MNGQNTDEEANLNNNNSLKDQIRINPIFHLRQLEKKEKELRLQAR